MKFRDIPQVSSASYQANIPWDSIQKFIEKHGFDMNPKFQRGFVWGDENKSRYVEHCLKGGVSGKDIYFNHPGWMRGWKGDGTVVDGKQRISAVLDFLNDKIPAFKTFYSEFEDRLPMTRDFLVHVNDLPNELDVLRWYIDLNAGVPHQRQDIQKVKNMIEEQESPGLKI